MILRAAWLPRDIRNASGNGGGVLLGYMTIVEDPEDPTDRDSRTTLEFQQYKRTIYQKVLAKVFRSLKRKSWHGEPVKCGDGILRILYPGFLIESMDGEEASNFCACRASLANHPRCLVHKTDLSNISTGHYELRTAATMQAVIERAGNAPNPTAREKILKGAGLHYITHFLWQFRFSDPYLAISYDTLHSDDLGKWGHHLWELLLRVLEDLGQKGVLTAYIQCVRVSAEYDKSFDFPKHHALWHVIYDLEHKCTTDNYSTRPGEGFQQEVAEAYQQTNGKRAEHQMARIDSNQEAIALIRMTVDNDSKAQQNITEEEQLDEMEDIDVGRAQHWRFGSEDGRWTDCRLWEELAGAAKGDFKDFDLRLRTFLSHALDDEVLTYEDSIVVKFFKCCYVNYQSLEDWTSSADILRCNDAFHGQERFDCVLVNYDRPDLAPARLRALFRCRLPSGKHVDVAMVRSFSRSGWAPRTRWEGGQVYEELNDTAFVMMDYVIRGALMTPVFSQAKKSLYYMVDTVDADMFLRASYSSSTTL
ncbi:hypothetical protein GLOTRDRAFT_107062 [Gloeophyllum trabeum ATCC 11539]|uniref:Uncharacterized protein n=1 Tax=Gloeophyllum trabeum (strain ATCC 11539 / FP-39264 / Madison 617) TaxID=670483 RepID=S7RM59_GLOTA|nr:uncharacterized protein GLOTRDRAFT_107062 [Gloeophyllum trabeum ATCC 11539]EPQ53799.1 hypothetical protein GLOTRDRAFT_107062 [Gloeophyllum trabeum ATCC 11539]